jgi:hypothetical protein
MTKTRNFRLRGTTCIPDDLLKHGIDWFPFPKKLHPNQVAYIRAKMAVLAEAIQQDWLREKETWLKETAALIARDAVDQQIRDQGERDAKVAEQETAEAMAVIDRLVERELSVIRKHRKRGRKAEQRERMKLQEAQRKLARAKLARLRRR